VKAIRESSLFEVEHQPVLEHILAKLLMIEAVQANIIAHLAADEEKAALIINSVLSKAENELRVMALGEIEGVPPAAGTADRALVYLAEYAESLRSLFHIPVVFVRSGAEGKCPPAVDPDGEDLEPA
jgi:hypothetical protein